MDPALVELKRRLAAGASAVGAPALRPMWAKVARDAEAQTVRAVRGDLGDLSMSRFSVRRPKQITAKATVTAAGVELAPTPGAGGAFKVLDSGRRSGRHGTTSGKRTWSDTVGLVVESAPKIVEVEVTAAMQKAVTGG